MWKFISLSYLEYKDLNGVIEDFVNDMDKLTRLQRTGHVPLILSRQYETQYNVAIAPNTFEVLGGIDARFLIYNNGVVHATIDAQTIETHELLLGNKETFKSHQMKKTSLERSLLIV